MVTNTLASPASSAVSSCGCAADRSTPSSCMTVITSGWTWSAGRLPAKNRNRSETDQKQNIRWWSRAKLGGRGLLAGCLRRSEHDQIVVESIRQTVMPISPRAKKVIQK
jgi:hypothetical protein